MIDARHGIDIDFSILDILQPVDNQFSREKYRELADLYANAWSTIDAADIARCFPNNGIRMISSHVLVSRQVDARRDGK